MNASNNTPLSSMYSIKKVCRVCEHTLPDPFLDLGEQTLANNLSSTLQEAVVAPKFPLQLVKCEECSLVQLTIVVDPKILFDHYLYTPSQSRTFREHFAAFAESIAPKEDGLWIDIGSNDGLLLSFAKAIGWSVCGIEPAREISVQARVKDIPTITDYWDFGVAEQIVHELGNPDVITATNVFAHVDDIHAFVHAVKHAMKPDGVFIFEVPYLPIMLTEGTFDLVYHEHLSYFSYLPIEYLFQQHDMHVSAIDHIPIHGGSIRVFVKNGNDVPFAAEDPVLLPPFVAKVENVRMHLEALLDSWLTKDLVVAGYGAPAKATVLINYVGASSKHIKYIVDDNPMKQDKFLPGSAIPIVSSEMLEADPPDVVIIFPWNVAEDILPKVRSHAKTIVVPQPEVRVLEGGRKDA